MLANNGVATLKWQFDGNLVLYDAQGAQWATSTNPDATGVCFQGDGNLVIYRKDHENWATGTNPNGAVMKLQHDCNIVIEDWGGTRLWQAGTICRK